MAPLVRRTGTPRGQTPELVPRGGRRETVAVAAAWWLSPRRDRLGWFARRLVHGSFDKGDAAPFREALL